MPFIPDAQPTGYFVPDTAAPAVPTVGEPRTLENIGGFLTSTLGRALHKRSDPVDPNDEAFGKGLGLDVEDMVQAIRQYVPGMDRDAAIKAAAEIENRLKQLPTGPRVAANLVTMVAPMGGIGKLAEGAEGISKAAQALRTLGAGGVANAALTPVRENGDFSTQKAGQFGEGMAGTALFGGALSGMKGLAGKLQEAWKSGDSEVAAAIMKAIEAAGFGGKPLDKVSTTAGKEVAAAGNEEQKAASALSTVESKSAARIADEKKATDALKEKSAIESFNADSAANFGTLPHAGATTPEAIGDQIRAPLTARQEALEKTRATETGKLKQIALSRTNPVPTQGIIDYLESSKKSETIQGKKDIDKIIKDLTGYDAAPIEGNTSHGILSRKLENIKSDIQAMKARELVSPHINGGRVEMLSNAEKMLAGATPEWKNFFEQYGKHSVPLDAFTIQEGAKIGSLTKVNPLTGAHDIPSEKVADHIIEGGVTRVRAALKAADNDPAVKKALETHLWQRLDAKSENGKLTPVAMDSFMLENAAVLKELGLSNKFEAQRGLLGASDAIKKTTMGKLAAAESAANKAKETDAIRQKALGNFSQSKAENAKAVRNSSVGKLAEAKGNPVDSFNILGRILEAPTGRLDGLTHLVKLTENDPAAREALKYAVVMHGVTQKASGAALSRAAVLPDLEKSGLFSKADIAGLQDVNRVVDDALKSGSSDKTTAGSILSSIMSHTPGLKTMGRVIKGGLAKGEEVSQEAVRQKLLMAAVDPAARKNLLSRPTQQTIQAGLTAMERANVFMAAKSAGDTFNGD